jgi:polysaccharide deacetylase family protein (PEP-CTERM system associated)
MINALTVDVEEYFDASEVRQSSRLADFSVLPSRVEMQTRAVLEILSRRGIRATFFVVGAVAERCPQIVREIVSAGHEIGCHSHTHRLVYELTPDEFRRDTLRAVKAIQDACGETPRIYRAPSYSITVQSYWALEILVECGFTHDSSIYPIYHDRYGIPGFQRHAHIVQTAAGPIYEIPIATVRLSSDTVSPVGGGGYLRLLPYCYTAAGIRRINREDRQPACIYFHPWELDNDQPRIARGVLARLRTYTGLRGMTAKLNQMITDFRFDAVRAVYPPPVITPIVSAEPAGVHAYATGL